MSEIKIKEAGQRCCPASRSLVFVVTLLEALDTTALSHASLTACEERMALGADIDVQLLFRGACRERIAAAADYFGFEILRMNSFFHVYTSLSPTG